MSVSTCLKRVVMRAIAPTGAKAGLVTGLILACVNMAWGWDTNDWQFLETIEKANLRFFQEQKRGPYGLLLDVADYDMTFVNYWVSNSSVAGIGYELTAMCLGHYRGWVSYSNAYEQVLQQMRLFNGWLSSDPLVGERVNGWTWHMYWIDGPQAGMRYYMDDGLSLLDHSMFIAGCIFVSEYFKGTEAGELAANLYRETTWSWRPNSDYNFGYSENLLAIVESAEAPEYKKGEEAHNMWDSFIHPTWPRNLQFYFWQYPHCWVDFRNRWDFNGENHAIVAQQSILEQRQYAIDMHNADPDKYDMLGTNCWGWTAASASGDADHLWGHYRQMAPWGLTLDDIYYDQDHASDSGSITPFALPPCMIYAGTETMAAMKYIFEEFYVKGWDPAKGERPVWDRYGFLNCLNKGKPYVYDYNSVVSNRYHPVNAGIDYGPNVLMLENYKIGSTWRWFMQNTSIDAGMYTIGFGAPQIVTFAAFSNQANEFGGGLGHWENDGTPVSISYVPVEQSNDYVRDYAVRIAADHDNEGGWIELNNSDQRAKAQISFWIKGGDPLIRIEVGLKDQFGTENKVNLTDLTSGSMPTQWTQVKIPIERFCLTGNVTNDTWPGSLDLVSFAFTSSGGGTVDIDYLSFEKDTLAPVQPTNYVGVAAVGDHARICWDPSLAERDVVGYHVWRRYDATSGFTRVTGQLVPAYKGVYEDTNLTLGIGQEARYAIQAFDNSEPANSSSFSMERKCAGGRVNVDWNNGRNPNVFGGQYDNYWGPATDESLSFVYANGPDGDPCWVRRSYVTSTWCGHYIDLADGNAGDYWALSFAVRGGAGGEQIDIGLKDSDENERKVHLDDFLAAGALGTQWVRVTIPLSEFTNVNASAVRNLSFTHQASGEIFVADIAFDRGQRALLVDDYFTEAEHYTRQNGSATQDLKTAASGGEVLGQSWAADDGDYADYEFYVARELAVPTLNIRYACNSGDGRLLEIRWDDQRVGDLACTNTAGWGDSSNEYSWAAIGMPSATGGLHKLTFYASGGDDPVNLDCWRLVDGGSAFRECEDFTEQTGSSGEDLKAGASGGEVLGQSWGATNSSARYSGVDAGAQTGAWFHLWYALYAETGRVIDVEIDGTRRARAVCTGTRGWGEQAWHFDRASAFVGALAAGSHEVRLFVTNEGYAVNLDCFFIGDAAPEGFGLDSDADGMSDRQEGVAGTSASVRDTDGDGIDDGDEFQFGRFGQLSDPLKKDTDGDGMDDGEEAVAGTDPNDDASMFQWLEISKPDFPMIGKILRWPSSTGRLYSISYSPSLLATDDWALITSSVPSTPPENTWTDEVARPEGSVFYRIDVRRNP